MTVALRVFLVAVLLVVIPPSDMHAQLAESAEQLKAEHQNVLDDLNVKDAEGKPLELDDPRVPGLA